MGVAVDELPRYYTAAQVAKALRFSQARTLQLIRDGRIKAIREGRTIRVSADAVREFEINSTEARGASDHTQRQAAARNVHK